MLLCAEGLFCTDRMHEALFWGLYFVGFGVALQRQAHIMSRPTTPNYIMDGTFERPYKMEIFEQPRLNDTEHCFKPGCNPHILVGDHNFMQISQIKRTCPKCSSWHEFELFHNSNDSGYGRWANVGFCSWRNVGFKWWFAFCLEVMRMSLWHLKDLRYGCLLSMLKKGHEAWLMSSNISWNLYLPPEHNCICLSL